MGFKGSLSVSSMALLALLAVPPAARSDEIGLNDFRISHMGPDGNTSYAGSQPDVAYNSAADEFFVVWIGIDDVDTVTNGAAQIFGQRLDAKTGELLGARVRLSDIGDDDSANPTSSSFNDEPRVAYDSQDNQYLVVWAGSDVGRTFSGAPLADGEREVFGQRVNAATGEEIGDNDFRISVTGTDGDAGPAGLRPSVAYNSANNEYLVVWMAFDSAFTGKQGDLFGQRIGASDGSFIGSQTVLRVPDPDRELVGNFLEPDRTDVAYNSVDNEYFAVFRCDCFGEAKSTDPHPGTEIFGQRLDANAVGIGVERQLSDMGPDTDFIFFADVPRIAFNSMDDEYLVVWQGNDAAATENEIYGQRVGAAGDETGTNDIRISFMGPDGDSNFGGFIPAVAYNSANDEYFVVWYGDTDQGGQVDEDIEIFGQRVAAGADASAGDLIGSNVRLSDMMGIGTAAYAVQFPNVAYDSADNISLVVWSGVDDVPPLVELEGEIFGQLVTDPACGNGVVESPEACDDGNADETDACLSTCAAASCGDGFVQAGVEDCDGGVDCAADCTLIPAGTTGGTTTGGETTGGTSGGSGGGSDSGGCSLIR
ncbi:MAG TPA: hypothetical protein VLJ37_01140 [bacterium]|nr:hypothetical protein [bacterium]